MTTVDTTPVAEDSTDAVEHSEQPVEEILIEEISIDGMCGVY